jgi:hypothetical protein
MKRKFYASSYSVHPSVRRLPVRPPFSGMSRPELVPVSQNRSVPQGILSAITSVGRPWTWLRFPWRPVTTTMPSRPTHPFDSLWISKPCTHRWLLFSYVPQYARKFDPITRTFVKRCVYATYTHTHTHTYVHTYVNHVQQTFLATHWIQYNWIYMYVCVCVCVCVWATAKFDFSANAQWWHGKNKYNIYFK